MTTWHELKHTPSHKPTFDFHAKFQPPRMKTVAAEESEIFVDQPTDLQADKVTYRAVGPR